MCICQNSHVIVGINEQMKQADIAGKISDLYGGSFKQNAEIWKDASKYTANFQ